MPQQHHIDVQCNMDELEASITDDISVDDNESDEDNLLSDVTHGDDYGECSDTTYEMSLKTEYSLENISISSSI